MTLFDIYIPKIDKLKSILESLASSSSITFVKNTKGNYLTCNQKMLDLAGLESVNEFIGRTDANLIWSDHYSIYRSNDRSIQSKVKPYFFIEPLLISTQEIIDILVVKSPLSETGASVSGLIGFGIPLNHAPFALVLSQFGLAAEKLNLLLDQRLMIRIITQIMQLNNAKSQWKYQADLFNYGTVKFTLREAQCLHYLLNNFSSEKASVKLGISKKTVEFHIQSIKNKLNCYNKSQITNLAIDHGFIDIMFMKF